MKTPLESQYDACPSHSLKEFMGLSMKAQKLAMNNDIDDMHFQLITTLDLLPRPGEEREYYFIRLRWITYDLHMEYPCLKSFTINLHT